MFCLAKCQPRRTLKSCGGFVGSRQDSNLIRSEFISQRPSLFSCKLSRQFLFTCKACTSSLLPVFVFHTIVKVYNFENLRCESDSGLADRHLPRFCVRCAFVAALSPSGERGVGEVEDGHGLSGSREEVVCQQPIALVRLSMAPACTCCVGIYATLPLCA